MQCSISKISDLDRLNIVHVAGTKGKGTTCAYVDSILQQYRMLYGTPCKVGLFTSPHSGDSCGVLVRSSGSEYGDSTTINHFLPDK
ncbi:hypothetical protein BP00DRAFT_257016 [Aspergillus indologenus CBS 114.80]|uniref:Mur ligase central domain-containing protein n=1 Tax=Aspergillus indologenus CBS 114.80 TaxID=1450541 RepID=A0A2V5HW17_9EURO|nr:hypothetical protein BP00DRAFT_257016 [Aspergillus indologenus CBS 114.80]